MLVHTTVWSSGSLVYFVATKAVRTLVDLAARIVARNYSFIQLESSYHVISVQRRQAAFKVEDASADPLGLADSVPTGHLTIPDKFFLNIVRWCFPESEDDIRLYRCVYVNSCLLEKIS